MSLSDRGYLYHFWPQMSQIVAPKIISLTCVWPTYSVCQSVSLIHKITAIRKQSKTSFDAYSKQLISTSNKSPSFHFRFLTFCFFHMILSVYFIFDLFYIYRIHPFFCHNHIFVRYYETTTTIDLYTKFPTLSSNDWSYLKNFRELFIS